MATKKDIAEIVGMLSAAYPNFAPSPQTVEVYYRMLNDIDAAELKPAAMHCAAEIGRKFAPSVGELREAVLFLRRAARNVPSSYEAWEEVQKQIRVNGGQFGKPVWSSLIVEKAVNALGWYNLRMSEDPIPDRARFIQAYEQFCQRAETEEMFLPEVRGFIEARGGKFLAPVDQMKQLAGKMSK